MQENILASVKTMLMVLVILIIAAIAGQYILKAFGISMDAFKIVGGIILAFIGFQLLAGSKGNDKKNNSGEGLKGLIMFAASPGTLAMVITMAAVHKDKGLPVTIMIGISLAVGITLAIMIMMQFVMRHKKAGGQGMASSFMGLIIVAMGLQFMLDGIKDFF